MGVVVSSDVTQKVYEGTVYDPTLDSMRKAIRADDGAYVYVEDELEEGKRVRVTIEVLPGA